MYMNNCSHIKNGSNEELNLSNIHFNKGFWADRINLIKEHAIPYQWKVLNDQVADADPSHAIENFRIASGEIEGEFYGRVFQDSDVAKWLEAVSYILEYQANPELEKKADEVIDIIAKAQQKDGYLNTYFSVAKPDERWTNVRDRHELYCAGHMIEAGVAYFQATGKRKLLDVVCRMTDYIDTVFGPEEGKIHGYPGHQEIELALVRLYKVTNNKKYLNLCKYFIEERGQQPHFFDLEAEKRGEKEKKHYHTLFDYSYSQSHIPVKDLTVATGHAVRAMYFYSGIADLALEKEDEELKKVCKKLWSNVIKKQMYITGGIGSSDFGEAFSFDYDLPNDTAYTETCAAIGLVFWAQRMLKLELDSQYIDIMEKALYNGVLSGISLDGQKYFYVNPLEVWPKACDNRYDLKHIETERQHWFGCACCPPNITRLIASIGKYVYSYSNNNLLINLYTDSTADFRFSSQKVKIIQNTDYPWNKDVEICLSTKKPVRFTIGLRLPGWCRNPEININGNKINLEDITKRGFAFIDREWQEGDIINLSLPMPIEKIIAHPEVRKDAGKLALQRGPLVYCLEEEDNGNILQDIVLPVDANLEAEYVNDLLEGVVVIKGEAMRTKKTDWDEELYKPFNENLEKTEIKAVPYYAWANRDCGEMLVWIRRY